MRPTEATVDLGAIGRNTERLVAHVSPARVCAVVKADGYGHGAVAAGRAALAAGASQLAVALVEEGIELREAGIGGPILVLSEPRPREMVEVVDHRLTPSLYTGAGLAAAEAAASTSALGPLPVQLKVDTGMHRVGAKPADIVMLARSVSDKTSLVLEGVWTHCAVADEPDNEMTQVQLDRFAAVVAELEANGHNDLVVHAGNSAVALAHASGRHHMVRCGIATYGLAPAPALDGRIELEPVMGLRTQVSFVKQVSAGEAISYGLQHRFDQDTVVATIPIGYADGIRRSYSRHGGEVLVRGERRPLVGTVTMDQTMVDCGPGSSVAAGDEVVLIGSQGDETITATEIAQKLGTISYEVVCDLGRRVRRTYV